MITETVGVTETLIESAKKEFLEHGFQNANLRRISSESGVSTGSIYTRFGDKAGLFSAVVKPAAPIVSAAETKKITTPAEATSQGNEGTELVLKYIYENFDVFKLIFCHSAGTEYERYFDELAEIEEKYYREFVKQFSRRENMVSDFFIHVICRTGWSYIYEVVSHDLSYDEAQIFMKSIREFCFAGWGKVLGQNYEDLGL